MAKSRPTAKPKNLKQRGDARSSLSPLPGPSTSAKLLDHLRPGAHPSVNRPSLTGKSTGRTPPMNKRKGKGKR